MEYAHCNATLSIPKCNGYNRSLFRTLPKCGKEFVIENNVPTKPIQSVKPAKEK